jgi:LuxR family transcriptional regulator, maltose regulon positive regulatory protein
MTPHLYAEALGVSDLNGPYLEPLMRGYPSDGSNFENPPRPIRIYTLGRFAVVKDGAPISSTGRPQHKPMSLLKAVVAFGGDDVDLHDVIAALWAAADGDAARNAFDVALHRLRKLLERNDAVVLKEGQLSLNPGVCWVDVWEFERLLARVEKSLPDTRANTVSAALTERMLALYQGPFLNGASEPWMLAPRERLHIKFHRHIGMLGQALERASAWDQAAQTYQRALEFDPLIEEFHRHLMLCRQQSGRIAEALDAYRRCRDILSITLGLQPSAETQAVYRSLSRR